ncbi:MAG: imidazoleglycerol-phosphate dehydratase HisB [Abditibacteriales bacterium]|nr:imidazoleglycerol-phosphate dehydratase HisB [Abditibacteriales bacterium]MDW8365775.1 imidazoleglycerol-phosphate dehydratase HisB [Abditibacteriales bacterium]
MTERLARTAHVKRATRETEVELHLNLDGAGVYEIDLPVPFLKHMLELFSKHALVDLTLKATGDVEVDDHHLVEDVGIVLGQALAQALGDKAGIARYGHALLPMDESLVLCAIDLSGRACLVDDFRFPQERVGNFDVHLAHEFFAAFAAHAQMNLHLRQLAGGNAHHLLEAAFKATARALRMAVSYDERITGVPSTKGIL